MRDEDEDEKAEEEVKEDDDEKEEYEEKEVFTKDLIDRRVNSYNNLKPLIIKKMKRALNAKP